ncbi:unnamed protein product, partial [Amoebophrya sp. A120]|eukprot:GSA120T00000983001.1
MYKIYDRATAVARACESGLRLVGRYFIRPQPRPDILLGSQILDMTVT